MIGLLLVDDHASTREPLAFMLEQERDLTIVAQAGTIAEARLAVNKSGTTIDVAILDLGLPDGSGEELIPELRDANPDALALVLTYFSNRERLARAVRAGAAGVLHKSASVDEVIDAVRRLHEGEQLLTFDQVYQALGLVDGEGRDGSEAVPMEPLTTRELDVLQALADGLSDRQIADRIHISPATVRTHVSRILSKLDATSRLQALVLAVRRGIVSIG